MRKTYFITIITNIALGYAYISGKILLDKMTSVQILLARFALATVVLNIIYRKDKIRFNIKEEILYAAAAFLGNYLSLWLNYQALHYTTTTNVGVLGAIVPMMTGILGYIMLKDSKPDAFFWTGCVFAMLGVVLIYIGDGFELHILGDTIMIASGFFTSLYLVVLGKITKFGHSVGATGKRISFYSFIILGIVYSLSGDSRDWSGLMNAHMIFNLLILGIGISGLCLVGYSYSTKVLGAGRASVFSYLCTISSVIFASVFIGETVGINIVLATTLIIAGTFISEQGRNIIHLFKQRRFENPGA